MEIFPDADRLGLDIETTGLDPLSDKILTIQISDGDNSQLIPIDEHTREALLDVFDRDEVVIHNAYFDISFLIWHYDIPIPENIFDTMLAEKLLTAGLPRERSGLGPSVKRRLGIDLDKDLQSSFIGQEEDLTDEQIEYALEDARILLDLSYAQEKVLKKERLENIWNIERAAQCAFIQMWKHGIALDMDVMEPLLEEEEEKRERVYDELQTLLWDAAMEIRIAKRDAMQAELDDFLAARDAAAAKAEHDWELAQSTWEEMHERHPRLHKAEMVLYLDWQNSKYHETKLNKKYNKPEGMRRYVRKRIQEWNAEHRRPNKPRLETAPINLRSPKLKDILTEIGINLPNMKAITIEGALSSHTPEQRRIMNLLLEYKTHDKMLQAFGKPLIEKIGPDGKLRGHSSQIGTATGRPTMSKPNMLQMPADARFRSAFVASPGHVLIVADYSQMELRIMAQMSGDPAMVDAFKRGLDMHKRTAAGSFYPNIDVDEALLKVTKDQRAVGKTANFGILFGMQGRSMAGRMMAEGLDVSEDQANQYINQWFQTYPYAKALMDEWRYQALSDQWTATKLGRKRYFDVPHDLPRWMRGRIQRQGANHPIQGGNADITKLAMGILFKALKEIDGRILLQVYDELVVEVPKEHAHVGKRMVVFAMESAARVVLTDVPVQVEATISDSWNDEKSLEDYQTLVIDTIRNAA